MQELEAELKATPVEEELRLELAQQQEYIRTLEASLQQRSLAQSVVAAEPPVPPVPPPAPHVPPHHLWSEGVTRHRVLYANPKRWKSA